MGLTNSAVGMSAASAALDVKKQSPNDKIIALAGNPNVGKSTVFNSLTGLRQHTGNWPGKTVATAQGRFESSAHGYILVDIPGTYSLMAQSAEEEVARDFICFGAPDAVAVVCDATCLERNLNLVLQILEVTDRVIVCVNLLDEAARKGFHIDLVALSERLGVPVVGTVAQKKESLSDFTKALDSLTGGDTPSAPRHVRYHPAIEEAVAFLEPTLSAVCAGRINIRWLSLRLLEGGGILKAAGDFLSFDILADTDISAAVTEARAHLSEHGIAGGGLNDEIVTALVGAAEKICLDVVMKSGATSDIDRKIDRALTSRMTGYPVMLALLALTFWLTITGANYLSNYLSVVLFWVQDLLTELFMYLDAPEWLHGALVLGVYRTLAWVVSVMLPPMAIFFPLFTLLEDAGYLPRVAYNLDRPFSRCSACGKQALTMCMGFGCNAAGVVGCRIIDSPRERLLAILTNSLVPCNGRFPALIAVITMFFIGSGGVSGSFLSAALLTAAVVFSVFMTFATTKLLSKTLLKGVPSSFTLELPPYRKPQFGRVIVRSIFDRTLFVLGRAAAVAAPAGLVIWLAANLSVGGISLLTHAATFLDPFARFLGLDGVILLAFLLGMPANEIVIPIMLMIYTAGGTLIEPGSLAAVKLILVDNGWTWLTALCTLIFILMHWPCSTTLMTIKKETGSAKWTAAALLLPTLAGMLCCFIVASLARLIA